MKTYEQVKNFSEEKFKRTFGVERQTFQVMLSEVAGDMILHYLKQREV